MTANPWAETHELAFKVPGTRKTMTAATRADALERIFRDEVQGYAMYARLPPSEALQEFCDANRELWREYSEQVRELSRVTPSGVRLAEVSTEGTMAGKVWTGSSRAEILNRIFTVGVADYARESGLPMGEALSAMIEKNHSLWVEHSANVVPVQGTLPGGGADAALASEMNAYARENHVSLVVALSEVCKARPDLLREYREEIATIV